MGCRLQSGRTNPALRSMPFRRLLAPPLVTRNCNPYRFSLGYLSRFGLVHIVGLKCYKERDDGEMRVSIGSSAKVEAPTLYRSPLAIGDR